MEQTYHQKMPSGVVNHHSRLPVFDSKSSWGVSPYAITQCREAGASDNRKRLRLYIMQRMAHDLHQQVVHRPVLSAQVCDVSMKVVVILGNRPYEQAIVHNFQDLQVIEAPQNLPIHPELRPVA
jgi:hypothetical protein